MYFLRLKIKILNAYIMSLNSNKKPLIMHKYVSCESDWEQLAIYL